MTTLYFFLYLWVIFALLDPDPSTQINADPDADPDADLDPKPWLKSKESFTKFFLTCVKLSVVYFSFV
jgi:hypothetical protein